MLDTPPTAASAPTAAPDPARDSSRDAGAFVLAHLRWIRKLANRAAGPLDMDREDALQELVVWVLRAHRLYDPERGTATTFLNYVARGFYSFERTKQRTAKRSALKRTDLSQFCTEGTDGLGTLIADPHATDAGTGLRAAELRAVLLGAMGTLPENYRSVLCALYGIGQDPETLASVGRRLGVTRARVSQIDKGGLKRLEQRAELCELLEGVIEMHATEAGANLEGGAANGAARLSGRGTGTMGATPSGAKSAAGEFVLAHLQWIRKLAHRAGDALGIEREDAVHELVIWVIKKHPKYDPARGKPTTFLNAVVRSFFSFEKQKLNAKMRTGLTRVDLSRGGTEDAGGIDALVPDERATDPAAEGAARVDRAALEVVTAAVLGALPANRAQLVRELFGIGGECLSVLDVADREGVCANSILARRNTAFRAIRPQLHKFAGGCLA